MGEGSTGIDAEWLARGRLATHRLAWNDAFEAFSAVDGHAPLDADDLQAWAMAAYLVGHAEVAVDAHGRAHRLHLEMGDTRSAIRCGFWAAFMLVQRGDMAPAGGWFARCMRLLEDLPADAVEHGYLLVAEAFRLLAVEERWIDAHAVALRVVAIGRRASDEDLLALGLNIAGRSLIGAGRPGEGLASLDEAMVSVGSGALSPVVAGTVYCSLIEACEEIAEWRRAREWTEALTRWCERQRGMVTFTGQCLTHRAHIMRLGGDLQAAAEAARSALQRFVGAAGEQMSGQAFYESGEVHRVLGESALAEEAYREASDRGRDPQPGLALLRLAQGRPEVAAASLRRLSAEWTSPIARIPLLPAYVEVMLAVGDVAAAEGGACELTELAGTYGTDALRAEADGAHGAVLLAAGEADDAVVSLRRAAAAWRSLDAPYETARTRVLIARACDALGDRDTASLELDAAIAVFTKLGISTAHVEILGHGVAPPSYALTPRQVEVLRLVATGITNPAIANELSVAVKTVDRHVANILTKLGVPTRTAATAFAYDHDLLRPTMDG